MSTACEVANDTGWRDVEQCESCGTLRHLPAFCNVCEECGGPHGDESWNRGVGKNFPRRGVWYLIESRFQRPVKYHPTIAKIGADTALEAAINKAKSAAEVKSVPVGT